MLIWAAARAAPGEFTVYHNGWHTPHAEMLRLGGYVGLLHVMDD